MYEPALKQPGATDGAGPLSPLERAALAALLAGEGHGLQVLRDQLGKATVASRTHSGVGFVTRIVVPDDVPALPVAATPRLQPLRAAHPRLAEAAQFLLELRGGRLAVLEAYCFEGMWPADEAQFRMLA
jgi:hypothetical protein